MADLLLTAAGDLDLTINDFQIIDGIDAIRQELQIRYRFFLREWFLNPEEGIPYIEEVLKKNPNEARVRAIMAEVALDTPGVVEVQNYTADLDGATRELTIELDFGAEVNGTLTYNPFVVRIDL